MVHFKRGEKDFFLSNKCSIQTYQECHNSWLMYFTEKSIWWVTSLFIFLLTNTGFAFHTSYQNLVSYIQPRCMICFMKKLLKQIVVYSRRFSWWNATFTNWPKCSLAFGYSKHVSLISFFFCLPIAAVFLEEAF